MLLYPELSGSTYLGETEEEALRKIQGAIALYLEPTPINLPKISGE